MSGVALTVAILLGLAALATVLSVVALLVMRDLYERLHFTTPVASVTAVLVTAAVLVQSHLAQAGIKSILITIALIGSNTMLNHATARAARVRQFGHWVVQPDEHPPRPTSSAGADTQREQ